MYKAFSGAQIRRGRSSRGSAEIAQFIPAVYILFILTFFPLINIGALFVAAATQYLATNDFVSKASQQQDFASSLNAMASEAFSFQSVGLARFISMMPQGGYVGCGDDLYVVTTNIASGAVSVSSPDTPISQPVNTATSIYELSVTSKYSVSPLINLSQVPLLGNVPGLGQPVNLTFTASRPVEHPGGLQISSSQGSGSGASVALFNRTVIGGSALATASNVTWRNPNIYAQILAAGKTVVSENVVIVPAKTPFLGSLTPTGLTISPGQQIWIDTQASGTWETAPQFGNTDANGYPGTLWYDAIAPTLTYGVLLGEVGNSTTPFVLGNDQYNFPPPGSGALSLVMNNCAQQYMNGVGYQEVRVVVVQ